MTMTRPAKQKLKQKPRPSFRLRLNCVDSYQASPTGLDYPVCLSKSTPPGQMTQATLPIIRVFGATESGQKVCAHIHGAFPYLYVEYEGSLEPSAIQTYIFRLHASIDHALCKIYRRNHHDPKNVFVARITPCKGTPFFGFHVGWRYYLKIYLLNPGTTTRVADLLRSGAILRTKFQPYEAHLQYIPQWMIDYNLYGCAYIDCAKVYYRYPLPPEEEVEGEGMLHAGSIQPGEFLDNEEYPRISHCQVEVDIQIHDILNRLDVEPRLLHSDFLERKTPMDPDRKLVPSMAELWKDERRRRGVEDIGVEKFGFSFSPEAKSSHGGWYHEEDYREVIANIIKEEREKDGYRGKPNWDGFVENDNSSAILKTTWETVEDFYSGGEMFVGNDDSQMDGLELGSSVDVDEETMLLTQAPIQMGEVMEEPIEELIEDADPSELEKEIEAELKVQEEQRKKEEEEQKIRDQVEERIREEEEQKLAKEEQGSEGSQTEVEDEYPMSEEEPEAQEDSAGSPASDQEIRPIASQQKSAPHQHQPISESNGNRWAPRSTGRIPRLPGEPRGAQLRESQVGYDSGAKRMRFNGDLPSSTPLATPSTPRKSQRAIVEDMFTPKKSRSSQNHDLPSSQHEFGSQGSQLKGLKSSFPVVKDGDELRSSQNQSFNKFKGLLSDSMVFESQNSTQRRLGSTKFSFSRETQLTATQSPSDVAAIVNGFPAANDVFVFAGAPPTSDELLSSLDEYGLPHQIYQDPYYSNPKDIPSKPFEYAGKEFKWTSDKIPYLQDFNADGQVTYGPVGKIKTAPFKHDTLIETWEYSVPMPTREEVEQWLFDEEQAKQTLLKPGNPSTGNKPSVQADDSQKPVPPATANHMMSQIEGPTQKNKHGFKFSQKGTSSKKKSSNIVHETQHMSMMSLEVHVNTRGTLLADPAEDEISAIFWSFRGSDAELASQGLTPPGYESGSLQNEMVSGVILFSEDEDDAERIRRLFPRKSRSGTFMGGITVDRESTELDVLLTLVRIVREFDPDIVTGYEVHMGSWGYVIERARLKYEYNMPDELSRVKVAPKGRFGKEQDKWGFTQTSSIRITGRHLINIWRVMRGELNLLGYTQENVVFHMLHRRIPHYSPQDLTRWWTSKDIARIVKVPKYYVERAQLDLEVLEAQELVMRTSEQARLLGVDFFSVFSRGSQFKVESLMFRIAKPEGFLLISPSRKEVGNQNALECLPLVMEPFSNFYTSPVLVLDFQSLYPSVMIAFNYCYSTCLGRIMSWRNGANKLGFMPDFQREPGLLELLEGGELGGGVNIAPNGMMYAKESVRKSLLSKMLMEILETRVMVKNGMKGADKLVKSLLNNRQLALKLIANVTYGYTSASFSGRMPCAEIADSIVQTGRETLEKAIHLIHATQRWGAEVVYGDTDSLFVHLPGRTRDEAFVIGDEIAKAVTDMNPRPIKLKFEKVYHPCVLMTKKRYVGWKFESPDQKEGEFDAKGIETVRRDGTPAEQKIEETVLKMLFRKADLSEIKTYFQRQCTKIMLGKVSIQDFCFAKEVKLGKYTDNFSNLPPGVVVAAAKLLADPRADTQYGERVPYVIVTGPQCGNLLSERSVSPMELLLSDGTWRLDSDYYINKNLIPPLDRIFNLVGCSVQSWYDEMPKIQRLRRMDAPTLPEIVVAAMGEVAIHPKKGKVGTIESFMGRSACLVCNSKDAEGGFCPDCLNDVDGTIWRLKMRLAAAEKKVVALRKVCISCAGIGHGEDIACDSLDCSVLYGRLKGESELKAERAVLEPTIQYFEDLGGMGMDW